MAETIHIVFGEAGAVELRDALRQLERDDRVLECPENLSFGPILPADPTSRAEWVAAQLAEPDWREIVPEVEAFWATALSAAERHVVWCSRRVTSEYCGFLEFLWRIGDRACDIADLTDATVPVRNGQGDINGSRRAICTSFTESYQFLDGDLFSLVTPLSGEARAAYRAAWAKLRDENSPLRVVTPDLQLMSAPLTHFDGILLKYVQRRFLKAARIIGHALMENWDQGIIDVDDFFLARRLAALSRNGTIESKGDLRRIGFSEVRLPQAAPDQ